MKYIQLSAALLAATAQGAPSTSAAAASGFKWFGVSESCAEFGDGKYPGVWGKDFTFPATNTIDTLIGTGMNIFRVPFSMERLSVGGVAKPLSSAYLANLTATINHITGKGAYAVIDPHNYGRYNGAIITSVSDFKTFWTNLATAFKGNSKVIFDTNNEYHDMDESLVLSLNQAAIDGIRGAGATSQYIFAEGNSWTGAWHFSTSSDSLKTLKDPNNMLVYQMHQYLDADGSGTKDACASATIGAERLASATAWLKANGKVGVLGEFGGGANAQCMSAVKGLLEHLKTNSDVWLGALWWAAGPWWSASTFLNYEPPNGMAYKYYASTLQQYVPGK